MVKSIIPTLLVLVLAACSETQETSAPQKETQTAEMPTAQEGSFDINRDESGRALRGYDAVAYFTQSKPVEGKAEYSHDWHDAKWQFVSADNRDKFAQNPEKYAPANGGYCTFGIVLRKKFDGDSNVWRVTQDKLDIFLNKEVQGQFFQDEEGNFQKVAGNWSYVEGKDAGDL